MPDPTHTTEGDQGDMDHAARSHVSPLSLDKLESDTNIGYAQRQAQDPKEVTEAVMKKYRLGPTGRKDAEQYSEDLRTFSNAGGFEGPKK